MKKLIARIMALVMLSMMMVAFVPELYQVSAAPKAMKVGTLAKLEEALGKEGEDIDIELTSNITITKKLTVKKGKKRIYAYTDYQLLRTTDTSKAKGYMFEVENGAALDIGTYWSTSSKTVKVSGMRGSRGTNETASIVNVKDGGWFSLSSKGWLADNRSTASSGGAIRAESGAGVYINGKISGCYAYATGNNKTASGGALYADTNTTVNIETYANITGCQTEVGTGKSGNGGAIWFKGDTLNIEGGTFTDNISNENGGFLEFLGTTCNIKGGTFERNKAVGVDENGLDTKENDKLEGSGGVIKVNCNGRVNILGGTFSKNTAKNGGVLHCTSSPVINVAKGLFEGNKATNHGGAFRVSTGTMYFAENAIARNNTAEKGGAISNAGKLQSWYANGGNPIVENNTATKKGGGIYNEGTFTSSSIYIRGNYARSDSGYTSNNYGGGLFNDANGKIEQFAGHITKNYANCGAGIANDGKIDTGSWHETLEIANNEAQSHSGGLYNAGYVYISSTALTIHNNHTNKNWGGGIFNTASGYLRLIDGKIYGNTANENGGAVNNSSTNNLILENITMYNNTASGYGGGIYSSGNMTLNASTIYNNEASNSGGGLYNSGTANIWGTTYIGKAEGSLKGNRALNGNGGGIYNAGKVVFGLAGVHRNEAKNGSGGGIYNAGTIESGGALYVLENTSEGYGAGMVNTGTFTHKASADISYNPNLSFNDNTSNNADSTTGGLVNTGTFTVAKTTFNNTSLAPAISIQNNTAKWFGITNSGNITINAPYKFLVGNNKSNSTGYQINNNGNSTITLNGVNLNIGSTTVTSGSQEMGAIQNGGTFNITSSSGNISGCRDMVIRNRGSMTVEAKSGDSIFIESGKENGEIVHNGGDSVSATFNAKNTVKFYQDNKVTTNKAINNEKGATLNLYNGNSIEVSYQGAMMNGYINYGIYNAGVVNSYANIIRFNNYGIYNTSTGTATVKGGDIQPSIDSQNPVGVQNEGTLTVDGGKISFNDIGINNKGTMNLNGGNVKSNSLHGIYNITGATINQTGGTVKNNNSSGAKNGIYLETGSKYNVSKDASVDASNYVYESSGTYINIVSPGLNISESDGIRFNVLPEIADLGRVIATTNYNATGESQLYAKGDAEAERSSKDYSKVFSITSNSFILRPGNRLSKGFDKLHTSSDNKGCEGEVLNSTGQSRNGAIYLSEKYNITYNPNKPDGVTGEVGNMPGTKNTNGKYYDTKFWNEDYIIPKARPTLVGMAFDDRKAWNTKTDASGDVYKRSSIYEANSGLNLNAIWKESITAHVYHVVMDTNGKYNQTAVKNQEIGKITANGLHTTIEVTPTGEEMVDHITPTKDFFNILMKDDLSKEGITYQNLVGVNGYDINGVPVADKVNFYILYSRYRYTLTIVGDEGVKSIYSNYTGVFTGANSFYSSVESPYDDIRDMKNQAIEPCKLTFYASDNEQNHFSIHFNTKTCAKEWGYSSDENRKNQLSDTKNLAIFIPNKDTTIYAHTDTALNIQFKKTDGRGNNVGDATLKLVKLENGNEVENSAVTWTTSTDTPSVIKEIAATGTYLLTETSVPDGRARATDKYITFTEYNGRLTGIQVREEYTNATIKGTFTNNLTCTLQDVVGDSNTLKVYNDGNDLTIEMIDQKIANVFFNEDVETGARLTGGKFQLIDWNGKVVHEWTQDVPGYTLPDKLLCNAEYTIHQVSAAEGYYLTEDMKFTVRENLYGYDRQVFNSYPIKIYIDTKCTDETDPDRKLKSLAGVGMNILFNDGTESKSFVSNVTSGNKLTLVKGKKLGQYIITETSVPDKYCFIPDCTVDVGGEMNNGVFTTRRVKNDKAAYLELIKNTDLENLAKTLVSQGYAEYVERFHPYVKILKRDQHGGPVSGARMQVYKAEGYSVTTKEVLKENGEPEVDKDGKPVTETVVTGELVAEFITDGKNYLSGLKPGEYIIHEVSTPTSSYDLAPDKKINLYKVNGDGEIVDTEYVVVDHHNGSPGVDLTSYLILIAVAGISLVIVLRVVRRRVEK